MESLEDVEQQKHTNNLEVVLGIVLVDSLIVSLISSEVSAVFHRFCKLRGTLLNHILELNYIGFRNWTFKQRISYGFK